MSILAVITPVAGRHDHLRRLRDGLRDGSRRPDLHVLATMGEPDSEPSLSGHRHGGIRTVRLEVGTSAGGLPLARARNQAAGYAIGQGADVLVFLDVDCIPAPETVQRYLRCCEQESAPTVFSGTVSYLPPTPPDGYQPADLAAAQPHPGRPAPAEGDVAEIDARMFWSLSFAMTATTWRRIGGFCEDYVGYGAEDTDFAQLALRAGVGLSMVGGAAAFHQHHPTSDPPVHQLTDIVRNAGIFHDRWGWWPMEGWLLGFARLDLAALDPVTERWTTTGA